MVQDEPPLPSIKKVNTKGSCSAVDLTGDDFGSTSQCELYVEYNSLTQFVALGKCYEGVTMLHNVPPPFNFIKITVEKVLYGDVAVHVPTSEVTIVAETLHIFVAWPRHLVRPIDSTVYLCTNRIIYKIYYIVSNLSICFFVNELMSSRNLRQNCLCKRRKNSPLMILWRHW